MKSDSNVLYEAFQLCAVFVYRWIQCGSAGNGMRHGAGICRDSKTSGGRTENKVKEDIPEDSLSLEIPPLLLMTFVENSLKHAG